MLGFPTTKHDRPKNLPPNQLVTTEVCERLGFTEKQLQLARSAAGFPAPNQTIHLPVYGDPKIIGIWLDRDVDAWHEAVRELAKALR